MTAAFAVAVEDELAAVAVTALAFHLDLQVPKHRENKKGEYFRFSDQYLAPTLSLNLPEL